MAFKVRHEYALGETWQQYWAARNGSIPANQPATYYSRIDQTLGMPAIELRYASSDPASDGTNRRNQLINARIAKDSGTTYTPVSGETAWWGFRVRFGPATSFGGSFCNMVTHTSFGAIDSGPTFFGKTAGSSQNFQVIYNRGAALSLVAKPQTYWLDVKVRYTTHPTAGAIQVWTKRHDEPVTAFVSRLNASNIDSYGLSNDINRLGWGIYESAPSGAGHYDCNALQRYAIATTEAEINTFLAPAGGGTVVTAPPTPTNLRVTTVGNQSVSLACDAVSAGSVQTGDGYQWYVNDNSAYFSTAGPSTTITTVTPTGAALANGTQYSFRASFGGAPTRPVGSEFSNWTAAVTATPTSTPATPAVPTGLRVVSVDDKSVSLDWNDNTDAFGQYQVYRDGAPIASGLTQSQYTDADPALLNGNVYSYQVRAGGTGNQSALSAAVQATPSAASTTIFLSSLSDEFTALNSAVWTRLTGSVSFTSGRLVLTPSTTQTRAEARTDALYTVQAGDEVKVVDVVPMEGSASADRFYLSVLLGGTETRVVWKIADQQIVRRHVGPAGELNDTQLLAYNAATMKNFGLKFTAADTVQYFTETAAGVRTVHETRTLPFSFADSTAAVAVGALMVATGTVTASTSADSINPSGGAVSQQPANLDPAEEKRLLDDSLVPGTTYSVRLVASSPTPTQNGTQVSGGGYAAQNVQFTNAVSTGTKQFTATVVFPTPTADYPPILGFEIWTTGGTPTRKWFKAYSASEQRTPRSGGGAYRIPANTVFRLN